MMVLFLVLFVACPRDPLCMTELDSRAQSLRLGFETSKGCDKHPREVERLQVGDLATGDVLWEFQTNAPVELTSITYGRVPKGYTELTPAHPLQPNMTIWIDVHTKHNDEEIQVTTR